MERLKLLFYAHMFGLFSKKIQIPRRISSSSLRENYKRVLFATFISNFVVAVSYFSQNNFLERSRAMLETVRHSNAGIWALSEA